MSLPRNKNRKRRKLMSVSVAGAPLLGLLLSGCPDREVTLIDNSAGTESAGEPMVFNYILNHILRFCPLYNILLHHNQNI